MPEIEWSCTRALQQSLNHALLIDIIQDNFLTQLVSEPTGNHNILDLLITTSPDIIDRLVVGDCFSDHNSLSFEILRAILQESEAKLEMKNFNTPSFFVWR